RVTLSVANFAHVKKVADGVTNNFRFGCPSFSNKPIQLLHLLRWNVRRYARSVINPANLVTSISHWAELCFFRRKRRRWAYAKMTGFRFDRVVFRWWDG